MQKDVFSGKASFINLLIGVFFRKLHHYASGRSDDLPGQENVLQPERLDLLPVFRPPCEVHLACASAAGTGEQQEQIVGHHHQLKDRFIGPQRLK